MKEATAPATESNNLTERLQRLRSIIAQAHPEQITQMALMYEPAGTIKADSLDNVETWSQWEQFQQFNQESHW